MMIALAVAWATAPAWADDHGPARGPVVVELFTSQACAACPPADALLVELAQRDDVLALGMHVDYWDFLGWSDTFASSANSGRQRAYAGLMDQRMIYTPQMVIDGATATVGSRRDSVLAAIASAAAAPRMVQVRLHDNGEMLRIEASAPPETADVVFVIYERSEAVTIHTGENAGHTLTYVNPVRAWMTLERWSVGAGAWSVPHPRDAKGVAVVVQAVADGRVLGAARHDFAGAPFGPVSSPSPD